MAWRNRDRSFSAGPYLLSPLIARRFATAGVLVALVVTAFEGTVVTSSMPTITADLGSEKLYTWVFSAFLMASTLSIAVFGKLADQLGRRPIFLGGMVVFLTGSMLCGFASSVPQLIAFRVLQGLGAGAIQPVTNTISADLFTLKERAAVQSLFTGAWGTANVLGPVLGGWIVEHASWRWVFFVNVPFGIVATVLLMAFYQDVPRRKADTVRHLGATLIAGLSLGCLLFTLEPGALTLIARVPFFLAALGGAALFVRGQRRGNSPLLPLAFLKDPVISTGLWTGLFAGGALFSCLTYVPLWLTHQANQSALSTGMAMVPLLLGWTLGSAVGVKLLLRGGMRATVGGGFTVAFAGSVLLGVTSLFGWPVGWAYGGLMILGAGLGPVLSSSLLGPQARVSRQHRGMVTSTMYAARMLGGAVQVALISMAHGHPSIQLGCISFALGVAALSVGRNAPQERPDEKILEDLGELGAA